MRQRSSTVGAVFLLLESAFGCEAADPPRGGGSGVRELALETESVCSPEVDAPPLLLRIEDLAAGALDRAVADSLALTISSAAQEELSVALTAYSLSVHGERVAAVLETALGPRETSILEIPVVDLGLPRETLETSANLILTARPSNAAGETLLETSLPLYYHPRDGGFVFYAEDARVRDFDSGALTDAARALRRDAAQRVEAPANVVLVHTGEWLVRPAELEPGEVRP